MVHPSLAVGLPEFEGLRGLEFRTEAGGISHKDPEAASPPLKTRLEKRRQPPGWRPPRGFVFVTVCTL